MRDNIIINTEFDECTPNYPIHSIKAIPTERLCQLLNSNCDLIDDLRGILDIENSALQQLLRSDLSNVKSPLPWKNAPSTSFIKGDHDESETEIIIVTDEMGIPGDIFVNYKGDDGTIGFTWHFNLIVFNKNIELYRDFISFITQSYLEGIESLPIAKTLNEYVWLVDGSVRFEIFILFSQHGEIININYNDYSFGPGVCEHHSFYPSSDLGD